MSFSYVTPTYAPSIKTTELAAYSCTPEPNNQQEETIACLTVQPILNSAILEIAKSADAAYANIGDTITYIITLKNSGNTSANNVVITDKLPSGTTFVAGSLTGATGTPPTFTLEDPILAGESAIISYQVLVGGVIPKPNPIRNSASATFTYTANINHPNCGSGTVYSNTAKTKINSAHLEMTKSVNKCIAYICDTITYQISLTNTGNVPANNVIIKDPIPMGTILLPCTVVISKPYTDLPCGGISLDCPIMPGQTVTMSFKILITAIPNPNPIVNKAIATFCYTVDPQYPDCEKSTNTTNTVTTTVFRHNFSQQISNVIQSIALEQAALAAIANAEGAKIQRIAAMEGVTPKQLLCLNKSVTDTMGSIAMLEEVLVQKLGVVDCQIDCSPC